jgi:transcriptional regulator with XRE-family HTH domain
MIIGERLRVLREAKQLSQGDIEKRTGLLRCYISRVENGHTVPAIETLEKLARAMEVPLYQFFHEDEGSKPIKDDTAWAQSGMNQRSFERFRRTLSRIEAKDREMLLDLAKKMVKDSKTEK